MTSLLADRLSEHRCAGQALGSELGGTGTHRSSQISTPSDQARQECRAVEEQVGAERHVPGRVKTQRLVACLRRPA